jgi:hypothetical protein
MSPFGDRRSYGRLEVVGVLWGALDMFEAARIVDISTGGVCIEAPAPMPAGSEQPIQFSIGGELITVDARVCHVRPIAAADGGMHYLIGYEFISLPAALADTFA